MIRYSVLCLLLLWVSVSFADPSALPSAPLSDPLAEQLETLQAATQAQINAVMQQMEGLDPAQKPDLERQVVELKRQGEIDRLTLLLDAAQAAGEEGRVAEIEKALAQWQNPPQTQILPQVRGDKTAPADAGSYPPSQKSSVPSPSAK